MKTKKIELAALLTIIATGATLSGLLLGSSVLAAVGAAMYLLPIYIGIVSDNYF